MSKLRSIATVAAVTGALALTGGATASAAPATNWYDGQGFSSISSLAVMQAENDAYWRASIGGYSRFQCYRVGIPHITQTGTSYWARVTILCNRP
ncbi:hypothetical protein [Allokutzneria oryzae]|uniref:Lactococcin 972 family bacteriocin n=1 Tax=Allokutzneria oryzae TaxID=1378989 RepID=A0ABV6A1U8_9PSEU